ncbi:AraC family transcriptional regulator [bacterium SCSIO 12741]|nr:AraC family transcriptional regulator [bacterium SCSIO 12741]
MIQGVQDGVAYHEIRPESDAKEFIHCYWQLKTPSPLDEPFTYRVASDGCIDILWEQQKGDQLYITGFSKKFVEFELGQSFDYLGIRFVPAGFPTLFDIPASTLTQQFLPLQEVESNLNDVLIREVRAPLSLSRAAERMDLIFQNWIDQKEMHPQADGRFLNAMGQILKAQGNLNVTELDVGLSERQLRRLFAFYFGESAKTFAKVVRFQTLLGTYPTSKSLKDDKIFYDLGYFDQAHFIKEFKAFYGITPNRAFRR